VLGERDGLALGDHLTFIEQVEEDIERLKKRLEHISGKRLGRGVEASIRRWQMRRLVDIKISSLREGR